MEAVIVKWFPFAGREDWFGLRPAGPAPSWTTRSQAALVRRPCSHGGPISGNLMMGHIMKTFMLTFFGGNMALRHENLDQAGREAREKHAAAWGAWMAKLVERKQLQLGHPLEADGKRIDAGGIQ